MTDVPATMGTGEIMPPRIVAALSPSSISYPDENKWHLIHDQQLDALLNLSSPVQLNVSFAMLGAAVTSIPGAWPAFISLWRGLPLDAASVLWLVLLATTGALCAVCGYNGLAKKSGAETLVDEIRNRKNLPLRPPMAEGLSTTTSSGPA